jgi:hypothetical protein
MVLPFLIEAAPFITRALPAFLPEIAAGARAAGAIREGTRLGSLLTKSADAASKVAGNSKLLNTINNAADIGNLTAHTGYQTDEAIAQLMQQGYTEEEARRQINPLMSILRAAGSSLADKYTSIPGASLGNLAKSAALRTIGGGVQGFDTGMLTGRNPILEALSGSSQGLVSSALGEGLDVGYNTGMDYLKRRNLRNTGG